MRIPAGHAQVNLLFIGTAAPQGAQCTFGVLSGAGTAQEVAETVRDNWVTHLKANTSANITLSGVLVKKGPNSTGPFFLLEDTQPGGVGGDCDPPNTAWLIHKATAEGGRKSRGRLYYPGVFGANTSNGGIVDSGTIATLQSDWDDFLAAMETDSFALELLHADTTDPFLITSLQVSNKVATQRRRLR